MDLATEQLAKHIKAGDRLAWPQGTAEPLGLTAGLVNTGSLGTELEAFIGVSFSQTFVGRGELRFLSFTASGTNARYHAEGRLRIVPCHFTDVPRLIDSGEIRINVLLLQAARGPTRNEFSLGVVADYLHEAARRARSVIVEVNPNVPFTHGDTTLKADQIDALVEGDKPMVELPGVEVSGDDRAKAIGEHVASLVDSGATLQLGYGKIPDGAARALMRHSDLSVHSGMIGDGLIRLIKSDAVNNINNPEFPGASVTGAVFGTSEAYRFVHRNPYVRVLATHHLHNNDLLQDIPQLVSINSAVEVDLLGQINAECLNSRLIGGVGGQVDWMRACRVSPRGRSIIALPATAADGAVSRIVPRVANGIVTTSKSEVDFVVTEYGVAELRGATLDERARALTQIAAPGFREQLRTHWDHLLGEEP